MKKIVIFSILLIVSVSLVLFKENVNINDDVYVVSNSESKDKESILVKEDSKTKEINNKTEEINIKDENVNKKEITVYISGEVVNPGIVSIKNDKRLYDAVQELGGVTENADLNRINLAIKLNDEQHYIIPKIGENTGIEKEAKYLDEDKNDENKKININMADIQELDNLPGVGEATANKIVKYREEKSGFNSIEEIKNVNGIGDKKYEDIKDLICVE